MYGILFSFLAAISSSLRLIILKKDVEFVDEYVASWGLRFFAMLLVLPLIFFIEIPELNDQFWMALVISGILNIISTIWITKALKLSDLSLTFIAQVLAAALGVLVLKVLAVILTEDLFGAFLISRRATVFCAAILGLNLGMGLARYVSIDTINYRKYIFSDQPKYLTVKPVRIFAWFTMLTYPSKACT